MAEVKETKKVAAKKATTTKKVETKETKTTKTTESVAKKPATKKPAKAENKKTLKVTLIRSTICALPNQVKTVKALGLKKLNSSNVLVDNEAVRGMIFTVKHLVRVEEI